MNFLTTVVVGRWCGQEDLGIFGLGLTLVFLLFATQDSLITTPYTVFVARTDSENKAAYRGSALLCHFMLTGTFSALLIAATLICYASDVEPKYWTVLASLSLVVPCWLLREFARRTAYAEFNLRSCVTTTLIMATVQGIGLVALVVADRLTPTTAFIAVAIGNLVAGLVWLWQTRHELRFSIDSLFSTLRLHWTMGIVLSAAQIVHTVGSQTIPWLVTAFLGTSVTGAYVACDQVIRFANLVIVGFMNVLMPRSARAFAEDGQSGMHDVVKRAMFAVAAFMALFCALIFVFGDEILGTLFGSQYAVYAGLLFVLSVAQAIEYISIGPNKGLIVLERVVDWLKAGIVRYIFSVVATVLLISQYGVMGAAYGVTIGAIMYTLVMMGLYWKAAGSRQDLPAD